MCQSCFFKNNKVITEMCNLGPPAPLPQDSWKTSSVFRSPGLGLAWGTWRVPFLRAGPRETTVSASRSESGVSVHVQKNDIPVFILALSSPSVFPVQNVLLPALLQGSPWGFQGLRVCSWYERVPEAQLYKRCTVTLAGTFPRPRKSARLSCFRQGGCLVTQRHLAPPWDRGWSVAEGACGSSGSLRLSQSVPCCVFATHCW